MNLNHSLLFVLVFAEIQFDERTFARKVVKIFRTMRKMEQSKHLEPFISHSFQELSDVLLQNYKDSSSTGSGVFGSLSAMSGINNLLREKAMKPPTSDNSHIPSNLSIEDDLSQSACSQDGPTAAPTQEMPSNT